MTARSRVQRPRVVLIGKAFRRPGWKWETTMMDRKDFAAIAETAARRARILAMRQVFHAFTLTVKALAARFAAVGVQA